MLRHPDIPSGEISRAHLKDMPGWFCKLKIDGWRCLAVCIDGKFTYYSKTLKEIIVREEVRRGFEPAARAAFGDNFTLDCELTGNRRSGDAHDIIVLECLASPKMLVTYETDAWTRWLVVEERMPAFAVPATTENFAAFYDLYRGIAYETPAGRDLAEGVVLMRMNGRYIGGRNECVKHSGIMKCKWRAGLSGTTIKE